MPLHSSPRFRLAMLVLALALLACQATAGVPTAVVALATNTSAVQPSPSATRRPSATPSPAPPTGTPTPALPTRTPIPSATATFASAGATTATPAPPAQCPSVNPQGAPAPDFVNFTPEFLGSPDVAQVEQRSLDYLNIYGPDPIVQALQAAGKQDGVNYFYRDVTNDGVPELAFAIRDLYVFGCSAGAYASLLSVSASAPFSAPLFKAIRDMNLDGVPEIAVGQYSCGLNNDCLEVSLFEWTGDGFDSMIEDRDGLGYAPMSGGALSDPVPQSDIYDTDLNGTMELILWGGIPRDPAEYAAGGPWREAADVYMWNGDRFAWARRTFTPPEYRFQAVQDADSAALFGRFEQAEAFYRSVTENKSLEWWSPERSEEWIAERQQLLTGLPTATLAPDTPSPAPLQPNQAEFFQLGAYASYRLVVLYALFGRLAQADTEFQVLLSTFPQGNPGFRYAEMGTRFWSDFSSTGSIGEACAEAVDYATAHQDILVPLGSDYHGLQSMQYAPADVCPFG